MKASWMAKNRKPESLLFPPYPKSSPHYNKYQKKFGNDIHDHNIYELRPYPAYPRKDIDKKLKNLMKGKKPHNWPKLSITKGNEKLNNGLKRKEYTDLLELVIDGTRITVPVLLFLLGFLRALKPL